MTLQAKALLGAVMGSMNKIQGLPTKDSHFKCTCHDDVPFGKTINPHWWVPRKGLNAISPLFAFIVSSRCFLSGQVKQIQINPNPTCIQRTRYKITWGKFSTERPVPEERPPNLNAAVHYQSGVSLPNNPTLALLLTICVHVMECFMMMLHFENVRLGWSWAVAHWVSVAHWNLSPIDLYFMFTATAKVNPCVIKYHFLYVNPWCAFCATWHI